MLQWLLQLGYNFLFVSIFLFTWPYFTWRLHKRGHLWSDFGQRLGIYHKTLRRRLRPSNDLWIHAVSVGEVMLASVLIYHLRQHRAKLRIVLSTTTSTGHKMAKGLENELTTVIYNPTDFYWGVLSAFRHIRPKMLLLIESEIWPNYLWTAHRRKIPVYLVNARLSPRTEARYRQCRWFIQPVLKHLQLVFAQHNSDLERLISAGFPAETIFPIGSLKYEVADLPEQNSREIKDWWGHLGWNENNVILLGGSTHPGEEAVLARLFLRLKVDFPELRLVLAPRHAERGAAIQELCQVELGLSTALRTHLICPLRDEKSPEVLVLNSTGELRSLYHHASIVFIGKSLRSKGGQNFIEAARVGAPIIVGPNMQNFEHLLNEFLEKNGIVQVLDEFELAQRIREFLIAPDSRRAMGARAQEIFHANLGAGRRTAEIILQGLAAKD